MTVLTYLAQRTPGSRHSQKLYVDSHWKLVKPANEQVIGNMRVFVEYLAENELVDKAYGEVI